MKAIVSGFNAFGGMSLNPTAEIIKRISRRKPNDSFEDIFPLVLPTIYDRASCILIEAAERERPDIIVMLGLAAEVTEVNLERFALNLRDAESPDNSGLVAVDRPVVIGGPDAYRTAIDLRRLRDNLRSLGVQAAISNYAGAFVCNSVYYSVCHEIAVRAWPASAIFVHVPWMYPAAEAFSFELSPMEAHERNIRLLLKCLREVM